MYFMKTFLLVGLGLLTDLNLTSCWRGWLVQVNVTQGCARPSGPEHGFHTGFRFPKEAPIPVEHEIHYKCYSGYDRVGDRTRTCLQDLTWSGEEPWCNLTRCRKDDVYVENGRTLFGDSVKIGSTIRFECNRGYRRMGASEAVCLNTGRWSVRAPWCKPFCSFVKCPPGQKCLMNQINLETKCTCKNTLECPFEYTPICGSDGVTYASKCIMGMVACSQNRYIEKVLNGSCPKGYHDGGHQQDDYCSPCPMINMCKAFYGSTYGFLGKVMIKNETIDGTFLHFLIIEVYKRADLPIRGQMATVFMKNSRDKCSCVPRLPDGKLFVFAKSGVLPSGLQLPFIDERTYLEKFSFYSQRKMNLCWLW